MIELPDSFAEVLKRYSLKEIEALASKINCTQVESALQSHNLNEMQFLALLSPAAGEFLEKMAQKSHRLTVQHFGKTIGLYAPLYISDFCANDCLYCGFAKSNPRPRRKLELPEIIEQSQFLAKQGIRHVLLLTGEDYLATPVEWLERVISELRKIFASVSLEVFPMETEDYKRLRHAGADGLTIYQETYDERLYAKLHRQGPKRNFAKRLDTPEKACRAGFRWVNIGALYGLSNPLTDAFLCGCHAHYLQQKYLDVEIAVSFPRLNEAEGGFRALNPLNDADFVQFICALRLFLPRAGIAVSTREPSSFRNCLIPLGVTRYSAGSCTSVGGYNHPDTYLHQFDVSDNREVGEVAEAISRAGFQPIFKDWID